MLLQGVNSLNTESFVFYHFALDEVADDLVVEVLDGGPPDALLDILLLKGEKPWSDNTLN